MAKNNKNSGYGYGYGYNGGNNSMFSVQEAYKAIRTNLILSVIKDGCKKIVITSSNPHEGKSTTAVNVAISLSQAFKRVLIIDCDLRKARVHKALGVAGEPGLTNILSGLSDADESVQPTKYQNLYCLPAGLFAPNPAEMLASERTAALIASLEQSFDYIIFDTPPINIVSDALPLIKLSDGVVFIVRSKVTVYSEFEKALDALEFIDARLIGVIVNGDDGSEEGGGRKRYGGYGGYGGYGNSNPRRSNNE
ncbi:MAG: CpsD/CapB family tyrosine-protein kinase [Clostridia bacterium]|nr:CpsD/CapB family tyrosine-protein kinase [Clostridia bacterium]